MQALLNKQNEEIAKTNLLVAATMAANSDGKGVNKAFKQYVDAADPYSKIARIAKDRKMRKRLKDEVSRGSFEIEPISDYNKGKITVREEPRKSTRRGRLLRKPYAPKGK